MAGPFLRGDLANGDHFVPADKKLSPAWLRALTARGESSWYSGDELRTIGMPVGGICSGQLYLSGDGRLVNWDVFNANANSGYGAVNYEDGREPQKRVERGNQLVAARDPAQGFAVRIIGQGRPQLRTLDARGFASVRFCGEYPLARVEYQDDACPLAVTLEAGAPFVPLDTAASSLPCTLMSYSLHNRGKVALQVRIAGWLENVVCRDSAEDAFAGRIALVNRAVVGDGVAAVGMAARALGALAAIPAAPPTVFEDFERSDYQGWKVEGEAFGTGPAKGTLPRQQKVAGFAGQGLVNTYLGGDDTEGRLLSKEFVIERPFVSFLIGGGSLAGATCVNLLCEGRVVRSAKGHDEELLRAHDWDVRDLVGKRARIEILDRATGPWGHVNVDQIEFRDTPMGATTAELAMQRDYGTLALGVIGEGGRVRTAMPAGADTDWLLGEDGLFAQAAEEVPVEAGPTSGMRGTVGRELTLQPDQRAEVVFAVAWHFPNLWYGERRVGNHYAARFANAAAVVRHVAANIAELSAATRLWHDTWYDSTLPHWLLDRVHSTVANLATSTCQWWRNGRFWAWEGAGCCHGTCGHVWNYAQGLARLFPSLERSAREMQDFAPGVGFDAATGRIGFRGEGWDLWAGDAQAGYVLKALREHQCSADATFLERNWSAIRKATEFLIARDAEGAAAADGILEGRQHNTYDIDFYGGNTMIGSLYLAALRAAEEMAHEVGDDDFAVRCRALFDSGSKRSMQSLFDGEYFVQKVDLQKHPDWQYADGCLADQLFGQSFAHQVGLGHLYPADAEHRALESIWKYCWAPDVGPQNAAHAPERWFARPGEAGLFTCTWPKSKHMGARSVRYRDEIWTGIEYQVASHMAHQGMVTEALAICRGIHERYHPRKHNPWNEIECGDHYARSLASWGVLVALSGFEYHGPRGRIAFAPRITPEDFRCAFTAAEGFGTFAQKRSADVLDAELRVKHGRLELEEIGLALDPSRAARGVSVRDGDRVVVADFVSDAGRLRVNLARRVVLAPGSVLTIRVDAG
ncbi:MAG: GH116 family glycosyl hydrolase [Planctomycetota bacterium]